MAFFRRSRPRVSLRLEARPARHGARRSGSLARRRRERSILMAGAVIIAAILIIFGMSRLSMISALQVNAVEVSGAHEDIAPLIQAAAARALEGKYWGLFSRANALLYPHADIVKAVQAASARIAETEVKVQGTHALEVIITEKDPAAVICATLPDFADGVLLLENAAPCYFADEGGFIYGESPTFSGSAFKRYYMPDMAGIGATTTADFAAVQEFYDAAVAGGVDVEAILFKGNGEYELYARNPGSLAEEGTVVVYFNGRNGFTEELANLVSFWAQTVDAARTAGEPARFEYVDIRYGSNVFYRTR